MELTQAIRSRRMVRRYDPDRPVPADVADRLLDHATRAPSAGFSQGWDFLVLRAAADRDRFWESTRVVPDRTAADGRGDVSDPVPGTVSGPVPDPVPDSWLQSLMTAPMLIVCLSDKDRYLDRYAERDKGWTDRDEARWPVPYWDVDTGMAGLLMLLTAVDAGLGGCFFGVPPTAHTAFRAAFGVPPGRTPVGVVSVGYPVPDRRSPSLRRGRRQLSEVAHEGRFGNRYRPSTS